ncbi:OpgC domain-containing protein [Archangium sp.]|uniref:OpgC domain-containing protein n=1 Tax=Archangium sp. TaxID=1872627 RepID=UPI002ED7E826
MSAPQAPAASNSERDLRIDFLRGLVMLVLVVIHIEVVSLLTFLVWERVGLISGGEGFVILSGVVLGMVSRKRVETRGWSYAVSRLVDRAAQLYRVNVALVLSIALLTLLPFLDTTEVRTFTDRFADITYPLFPSLHEGFYRVVGRVLLLRAGPHQTQILGLYVALLLLTPALLWMLARGRSGLLLTLSWLAYFAAKMSPYNLTGAQFENAFPLLIWQVIFVHGLAAGYHRAAVHDFFTRRARWAFWVAVVLFTAFFVLAQCTTNPVVPGWARLEWIRPEVYNRLRSEWFAKDTLGLLRIVNYFAALVVAYALLDRFWPFFQRAFGWFLIPLGQASLYVFIIHLYLVMLISNVRPFTFQADGTSLLVNTGVHGVALLVLWACVKTRFLYRWIPR